MLGKWFDICAGQAQTWHSADGYIWGSSNTKRGSQSCRQRTQDRGQMVVLQPIRSGFEETMEWEETFILVWIATPTCPLFFLFQDSASCKFKQPAHSRHSIDHIQSIEISSTRDWWHGLLRTPAGIKTDDRSFRGKCWFSGNKRVIVKMLNTWHGNGIAGHLWPYP